MSFADIKLSLTTAYPVTGPTDRCDKCRASFVFYDMNGDKGRLSVWSKAKTTVNKF